jgi:tetratricopeptide (TPR) repeat protein
MFLRGLPLFFCALTLCAQDAVRISEGKLRLPTFNEGAPDLNPQFGVLYNNPFPNYPYTIRNPINKTRQPVDWRVVTIENEYLSCRVMPDLGGHLQGCTDRITGREVFYSNPVVRRTADNDRGTFIAMGIESSFPIAHSRVDASPVDYAWSIRDGVGRVVVEDTDRTSGMQWRDEFILRPGSSVLEQRVTLYNGSPARRGYHWWANAAVELDDPHLKIAYPVKWMLPHGDGPMTSWPINAAGVDLSDIANHKDRLGLFAHGSREPWMAIYKPKFRSGLAHFADPDQIKGKKIWAWGSSDTYVKSNLTENFNSYIEMQAGEFETQPEFGFLEPEQSKIFSHYWIPFRDLGGVSRATRDAVLNLSRGKDQSALIELNPTHVISGAKIRVSAAGMPVAEMQADLDPKTKFSKTINNAPQKLTIDVIDGNERIVLHHIEGEYDSLPFDNKARNPEPTEPPNDGTEAALIEQGTYYEQRDQWNLAARDYDAGTRTFPDSAPLRIAVGRAAFVLNRYADAVRTLEGINVSEAQYYYGVALGSTGQRVAEARAALQRAAIDPQWSVPARLQLALLDTRESGMSGIAEATKILQTLAAAPGASAQIGALEVALLRRTGRTDEARKRLAFWLLQDPANDMLRVEATMLGSDDATLWSGFSGDPEHLLNVAETYRQLNACDDALKILDRQYPAVAANETEPGSTVPQESALVLYYRGYCRTMTGQDGKADFAAASALSPRYEFPHREIYFRILQSALQQNPSDANAHAMLGDLDFDSLLTDDAIAEWTKALSIKRDFPGLYANLGRSLLEIRRDPRTALPVLQAGQRLDPNDHDIAVVLAKLSIPPPAPAAARSESAPSAAVIVQELNALNLASEDVTGRALLGSLIDPEKASSLFNSTNFPKDKQPDAIRRAYIEVQLERRLIRAYTGRCSEAMPSLETLGDEDGGLPFTLYGFGGFMKAAHFQYYMGIVENMCGDSAAAKKRWARISKNNEPISSVDYAFPLLAALGAGESDARTRIEAALQPPKKASADDPKVLFAQGVLLKAIGRSQEGDSLLRRSLAAPDTFVQYLSVLALAQAPPK